MGSIPNTNLVSSMVLVLATLALVLRESLIQDHNGKSCLASDLSTHDDDGNALQPDDSKIL